MSNLLYANRLTNIKLPFSLEGVKVPELRGIRRSADGVAA